jgi:hypothetical protein
VRWPWSHEQRDDPYWDGFINRPPADPNNLITHAFKEAAGGGVNPLKTEVHSPNVMSGHVKELARFYGADLVGIVELTSEPGYAIVCVLRAEYDTHAAAGIGGQTPALKGLFATFTLGAYIRELGYRATTVSLDGDRLAAAAGLGTLDADGHLIARRFGFAQRVHVADVILTDLPLEPDGREVPA